MYILKEEKLSEQDFVVPPDIDKNINYKQLALLVDEKDLNGANALFKYTSAKKGYEIVTNGQKLMFSFTGQGLEIYFGKNSDAVVSLVSASQMKQIHYYEHHGINGGAPLTFVQITFDLSDGGKLRFLLPSSGALDYKK